MLITPNTVITNIDDKPIELRDGDSTAVITLGRAIAEALLTDYPGERPTAAESVDRLELAERLRGDLPVNISNAEAETIKSLVAKRWPVLITGKVVRLINRAPSARPSAINGSGESPYADAP